MDTTPPEIKHTGRPQSRKQREQASRAMKARRARERENTPKPEPTPVGKSYAEKCREAMENR